MSYLYLLCPICKVRFNEIMWDITNAMLTQFIKKLFYTQYNQKVSTDPTKQLLIILLFRFSIRLSMIKAIASFADLNFPIPNYEFLRILFLSINVTDSFHMTFSKTLDRVGTKANGQ